MSVSGLVFNLTGLEAKGDLLKILEKLPSLKDLEFTRNTIFEALPVGVRKFKDCGFSKAKPTF